MGSDHLFDIPDKGADTYFLVAFVQFADSGEDVVDFGVVDDGHDGVVHFWPGVCAAVGVAIDIPTPLDILPEGEASYLKRVKQILDTFVVGLVVYNKDGFHYRGIKRFEGFKRFERFERFKRV